MRRWGATAIEEKVFGTADPEAIAVLVSRFCEEQLGAEPSAGLFYRSSAGCVVGVHLADDRDAVIKVFQTTWTETFLRTIQNVQGHLASHGFPAPRPLLAPRPLGSGRANLTLTEAWLPDPGMVVPSHPGARRASAAGLARQIALCRGLLGVAGLLEHPLSQPVEGLYPAPHSLLFDFEATAASAEWIDDFARRAKTQRHANQELQIAAHSDWSARNVRLDEQHVVAVYDWDSLALVSEGTAVGQAAATWSVTSEPGGSTFPSSAEIATFARDYEMEAGHRLSDDGWRAVGVAATGLLAYTSRCEHALSVTGRARRDQTGARDRLASDGESLLSFERPPELGETA